MLEHEITNFNKRRINGVGSEQGIGEYKHKIEKLLLKLDFSMEDSIEKNPDLEKILLAVNEIKKSAKAVKLSKNVRFFDG